MEQGRRARAWLAVWTRWGQPQRMATGRQSDQGQACHPTLPPLDTCCGDVFWGDRPSAVATAIWSTCQCRGPAAPVGPPTERKLGTGASMRFVPLSLIHGREKRREGPPSVTRCVQSGGADTRPEARRHLQESTCWTPSLVAKVDI